MCCSQPAPLSWIATHCRFAFFPSPFLFNVEIAKPFLKEVKILQKTFIHWLSPGFGHHVCSDIPFALPSYGALHFVPSFPEIPLFLFFHGDVNLVLVTLISIHKPIPLLHHLSHVACAISSRLPFSLALLCPLLILHSLKDEECAVPSDTRVSLFCKSSSAALRGSQPPGRTSSEEDGRPRAASTGSRLCRNRPYSRAGPFGI